MKFKGPFRPSRGGGGPAHVRRFPGHQLAGSGTTRRSTAAPAAGYNWPLARNDVADTCVAAALGCSLWFEQDLWFDDELAGLGEALSLLEGFRFVRDGLIPGVRLAMVTSVSEDLGEVVPGLVLGLTLDDESAHAALSLGGGLMASWGEAIPLEGTIDEAWWLEWETGS